MFKQQEMQINMGPQHPSTHGVLRLQLTLSGETVVECRPIIGYLHRGVEKVCESRPFFQGQIWTDRTDYCSAIANNLAWVEATEKLLGIAVPRKALYVRTLLAELNRLASHLIWLATHALDIGAMTVFLYAFREREALLDLNEMYCGSRLTTTAFRIGGLKDELPSGFEAKTRAFLDAFPRCLEEYETLLNENRIWLKRTVGIAKLSAEDAIALGVTGPVLRAAGVAFDVRKHTPYAAYGELDFDVPVRQEADTYARYLVRMEEMRQSARLVRQCLDGLPEGPFQAKLPRILKAEVHEIYHANEAPKGELGYYLVSEQGGTGPYRFHVRTPGFVNLQALPKMTRGGLIADVIAAIGTLDVVLGEIDR